MPSRYPRGGKSLVKPTGILYGVNMAVDAPQPRPTGSHVSTMPFEEDEEVVGKRSVGKLLSINLGFKRDKKPKLNA